MEDLTKILEWVGFSENEAKIYLAILDLWKAWITEVSKKSGIKRTTIYSYLDPLLEKWFIKRSIYGKRIFFLAESPKKILKIIDEKKRIMVKKMPLLESMYVKNSPNPQLEFYEWKVQIRKLYEEIWWSGLEIKAFFSPEQFYNMFWEEFDNKLCLLENQKGGMTRDLLRDNGFARKHLKNNPHSKSKLLPKEFNFDVDIIILWNSVVMISFEPLYAIKIKNKPFADFQRNIFDYFWKIL